MAIQIGSVEVDVIPNTRGIYARLRSGLVPAATQAGRDAGDAAGRSFSTAMQGQVAGLGLRIGQDIGRQIAARITAEIRGALRDGVTQGGRQARPAAARQGGEAGGAFARSLRARLEAAFRSMPRLDVRLSDTGVDADLARLRARLETLSGKTVGIDIDAAAARAEAEDIEERLRRLGAAHPNVAVRADTARAIAELQALREEIDRVSADPARVRVETDGAFGQHLRAAVQQAQASLPNINIGADTTPAEIELARLRAALGTLADQRVGIDIDATTANAQISAIQARLMALSASDADVAVRVDAAAATARLSAVQAMVSALDGQTARVDVDTSGALSAVMHLGVAIAGLAAIPAVPVLAAGIGSIAAAGVAAGVGIGALAAVAVPAFVGIAGALQAQKAAQDAATAATLKGGQAAAQAASRSLQMAGAQQALATAERNGARQVAQAQQQVRQARIAASDAAAQAAQRNAAAARAIEDAERSLARSQQDAKRAQEELTFARREAAEELQDLNARLAGAQLSQRDAALGVQEAQAELNALRAQGSKASRLDMARAQLAYDQAVQRLKDQTTETARLKQETAAANKAGVDGSETVRSAQDRLTQAQEQVADRARAVRDAQEEAARTQVETARQVAQAQERVGEATENVAVAQQAAADAVASAQRQIASASLAAAGGVDQAALAQGKYQDALAKLSPAARGTFDAFQSLRTAFKAWSTSLQPAVMPIFTRALNGIKNSLPGLTPFVLAAARAIGELQERVSRGFRSPWWIQFRTELAGAVYPALIGLGVGFGRIFKGMAGIIDAFLPHMQSISTRMQEITGRFASWGTSLKGSERFERFLSYSSTQAPMLARFLGDIGDAFYQIARAASPLSGPVLSALGSVFSAIASIAETLPWLIQLFYAAWIATKLWTLGMIVFNAVMAANPITLIIVGIVALVAAVVYAYQRFGWFRDLVQTVWTAIQAGAQWAWVNVLQPVFSGIWAALQAVGRWATWLWETVLGPVFSFIATAAKVLLTALVVIVLLPIIAVFKILGAIASWLWENAIGPAFRAIGDVAVWLWQTIFRPVFAAIGEAAGWLWKNAIGPAFGAIRQGVQFLGDKAEWLWDNILSPVFTFIGDKGTWLWENALKPAFEAIGKGVEAVGKSFEDAKKFIGTAWSKVEEIAKKPVRFIIDKIYNAGIVPTWNLVADAFGAPKIKEMKTEGWATGGILPGYTPGRDVHSFYSPTGGGLELSGGEAIMRPEFTRAVGAGFVNTINRIATSRGSSGVKAALAPALGGNPDTPVQRFASGGIFGWIGKKVAGVGSKAWESVKKGASWITDTLERSARAGLNNVVDPLLRQFPGAETNFGKMVRRIPHQVLDSIFGYSKEADRRGAGGLGGPRIQAALKWARTQDGLPYQWGGNGNPSWDCSGFMSAIESVIRGQRPHRRWSTHAFNGGTPPGWVRNGSSPFRVGITHAGVGHTAGTLGGVNVESRGGDGVVVGKRARSYNDKLFTSWYGFQPGKYDSGGYLQPGLNLAYNGTGRPEPVFTTQQANALLSRTAAPSGLQSGDSLLLMVDGQEFHAYVDDRADGRVVGALQEVRTALSTPRRR
ncbi:hypothetical protein [Streptomyces fradiae]|uniref:hypothetical protein n=1 Tax=Streptomyces fradiae TaxID=1906 RepID=UPI0036FE6D8C